MNVIAKRFPVRQQLGCPMECHMAQLLAAGTQQAYSNRQQLASSVLTFYHVLPLLSYVAQQLEAGYHLACPPAVPFSCCGHKQ